MALTIALLAWLGIWSERTLGGLIRSLLPDGWYFKGFGLLSGIVATLGVGLAANLFLVRCVVLKVRSLRESRGGSLNEAIAAKARDRDVNQTDFLE